MNLALLSSAASIHTIRWANGLSEAGVQVHLISQQPLPERLHPGVKCYFFPHRGVPGYVTMVPGVRTLLRQLQPDLVNAHYASGYGTTARLVNYRPWLLSVWGSDVYSFPHKSPLHRWVVTKNLGAADAVASTSHCMAAQASSLATQLADIAITPFGVDMPVFIDAAKAASGTARQGLTIGTVKSLKPVYGIDTLIRTFALLRQSLQACDPATVQSLRLRIVGGGPQQAELAQLAKTLGVEQVTDFVGQVPHSQVPHELAQLDIYVALSRSESFGVAAIEAGAMSLPVVVSDVGGLPEVVVHEKTGLVVPADDPAAAAYALQRLVQDVTLRQRLGRAGQLHVEHNYGWPACVQSMIKVYEKTIENHKKISSKAFF
ncbi:MAG: glycosyltransferase [Burkholderiaceae bacterium]|nr:glycosyltransferase [Burkholderiaceae bacterium]